MKIEDSVKLGKLLDKQTSIVFDVWMSLIFTILFTITTFYHGFFETSSLLKVIILAIFSVVFVVLFAYDYYNLVKVNGGD